MKSNQRLTRCLCILLCFIMLAGVLLTANAEDNKPKEVVLHKMEELAEVQIGAHYMIVYVDGANRYALGADKPDADGNSEGRKVPVTVSADNTLTAMDNDDYVLTLTNRRISGSNAYVQLEAGNGQRMKLGTASGKYSPMFNKAGGQITIYKSGDLWRLNNSGRYLGYSGDNFKVVSSGSAGGFEIWTDANPDRALGEERYIEYKPLGQSPTAIGKGYEMVIVYTDTDGKSYALTTEDDEGNNAVPVTIVEDVASIGGDTTTSVTVDRSSVWTVNDSWKLKDDRSTDEKSVFEMKLRQGNQYLWMSQTAMFTTDASKTAYLDLEWSKPGDDNISTAKILIHGSENDRYLGWDAENKQFVGGVNSRDKAITVRIYGPSINFVYNNYYRLTDLSMLQNVAKFVITVPDPVTGVEDSYLISAPNSSIGEWLIPFEKFVLAGDDDEGGDEKNTSTVITVKSTQSSVEFTHGEMTSSDAKGTRFDYSYIRAGGQSWYPQDLTKFSTNQDTGEKHQYAPFDYNDKKVRFAYGDVKADGQRDIYLRGNGDSYWLGVDSESGLFTTVSSMSQAVPIRIYALSDEPPIVVYYHGDNGTVVDTVTTQKYFTLAHMSDVYAYNNGEGILNEDGDTLYSFLGWSKDDTVSQKADGSWNAYLNTTLSSNLYDADNTDEGKDGKLKETTVTKYDIVGLGNPEKPDNVDLSKYLSAGKTELHLYPLYAVRGFDNVVAASVETKDEITGETVVKDVVGISDWKELQASNGTGYKDLSRERWLGSINVEVYKDGEPWGDPTTMYFSYHNDNTADLNIKFIWDNLVDKYKGISFEDVPELQYLSTDPLYLYMCDFKGADDLTDLRNPDNLTFPYYDQVGHFTIDIVYAKQAGGELNLEYILNWMTDHGGRLDNVVGGSTVKVYVTTKYDAKYYWALEEHGMFTKIDAIPGSAWNSSATFTTKGTENRFAADSANDEYTLVDQKNNTGLLDPDIRDGKYYENDREQRGGGELFAYCFRKYDHEIPVAIEPIDPSWPEYPQLIRISEAWSMRDKWLQELEVVDWSIPVEDLVEDSGDTYITKTVASVNSTEVRVDEDGTVWYPILGGAYGSGNTTNAYKSGEPSPFEAASPYTFHLYAIYKPTGDLTVKKTVDAKEIDTDAECEFTVTLNDASIEGWFGDEEDGMEFIAGIAKFTLKHGESRTAKGLPVDTLYTVVETPVEGYITEKTGEEGKITKDEPQTASFTNKKLTEVSVNKVWDDGDSEDRPEEVTVQLYRDGVAYGDPVKLNEANKWTYKWTELEENHEWTVAEVNVPEGYEMSVSNEGNDWTITNKKDIPEPPQTGDDNHLSLWGTLLILSIIGSSVVVFFQVKKHRLNLR